MAEKIQGKVKWFSNKKGYGFITPKEGSVISEDIFVHQSAVHSDGYRTLVSLFYFFKFEILCYLFTLQKDQIYFNLLTIPSLPASIQI